LFRKFLLAFALVSVVAISGFSLAQNASAQSDASTSPGVMDPVIKDQQGNVLSGGSEGQLLVISTVARNNGNDPMEFVTVIEARDENGVTQFLGFSIGRLEAFSGSEIGISWTPANAGDYQLRTFLLTGFQNPQLLTGISSSDIVIE
jgi:hypothetical protein